MKYRTIFSLSLENEFTYRLNFVLWRLRNVLRIMLTFFLWTAVYSTNSIAFGYPRDQMLSYVFSVMIVMAVVMSSPSNDSVGGEISNGDLSNFLVKPFSYLGYWFTRDLASKLLNLMFSIIEFSLLWLVFRPDLSPLLSLFNLLPGLLALVLATAIYFFLSKLAIFIAFWYPESPWGLMFFLYVLVEAFAGGIFPLDILAPQFRSALALTPFPYLIYYPVAILVGKITGWQAVQIVFQSAAWLLICYLMTGLVWRRGLRTYSASGR